MVQSRTGDPWEKNLDCQVSGHCYLEKAGLGIFSWLVYICQTLLPFCMKKTPNPFHWGPMHVCICHGWKYVRIYTEMRKIEMCIRRSPYFDNFQNEKNKNIFVSILFRNLVQSIHPTTCRSMFSEANACRRVAGSGENCCELVGSLLCTSEKSRAVWKKCRVCQRAMSFPLPLTKMWKTNRTGSGFRRWTRWMLKVRWAEGCN